VTSLMLMFAIQKTSSALANTVINQRPTRNFELVPDFRSSSDDLEFYDCWVGVKS